MKTILVSTALAALVAVSAQAQETSNNVNANGFHAGIGYSMFDGKGSDLHAVTLRGGADFNEYFGIEAEVSRSFKDADFEYAGYDFDIELEYAVSGFFKAQYPVSEQFSVYGRLGYTIASIKASTSVANVTFSGEDEFNGVAYGIGAEWAFAGKNAVRFDITRHDFDEGELDQYGVSYVRRF